MESKEVLRISYTKNLHEDKEGEVTERYVIPTFVPQPNMKAIDVTDLSQEKRKQLSQLYAEYSEYYKRMASTIFTFEDWLAHTQNIDFTPKWRTFKMSNVKFLD